MNNEADIGYTCPAENTSSERTPHVIPPPGRHNQQSLRYISLNPQTGYPYSGTVRKHSMEEQMKEINQAASCSAIQCRVIGNLAYFSEKARRRIALKQRFCPGGGVHPLFLTI